MSLVFVAEPGCGSWRAVGDIGASEGLPVSVYYEESGGRPVVYCTRAAAAAAGWPDVGRSYRRPGVLWMFALGILYPDNLLPAANPGPAPAPKAKTPRKKAPKPDTCPGKLFDF